MHLRKTCVPWNDWAEKVEKWGAGNGEEGDGGARTCPDVHPTMDGN